MTDDKEREKAFGLDIPFTEALARFAKVTKDELKGMVPVDSLQEGELALVPFGKIEIRKVFHDNEWWFSIVDVIAALTESTQPRRYWADLKKQLSEKEGFSELLDKIEQLPMPAADGKTYSVDAASTETLLRIIQSVKSPKAEPFKRWLARVGYERIQEAQNPEIAIKRAIFTYQLQGRSDEWIDKRIRSIVVRKELTAEWSKRGVQEGQEYATLTNIVHTHAFGIGVDGHKRVKALGKSHNLRDHMTDLELIFTMLGEKSTTEIGRERDSQGFRANADAAKSGGKVAGGAREALERETGKRVVSPKSFLGIEKREANTQLLTQKKPPK